MLGLAANIEEAVASVRQTWTGTPRVGLILGTGLGGLASQIEQEATISYADIPHFPESTVESHAGQLVCGTLSGVPIVAMEGRFHFYEGYTMQQVTFPVRVMRALGAEILVVTNAAGGMNPQYELGDLMVIEDQINLLGDNPLIGVNDDSLGPRFPDMSCPYDPDLAGRAVAAAGVEGLSVHRGVYLALSGPTYETPAEYRMARKLGADVVGMSTVPEVIAARHSGIRVLGLSIVSNVADAEEPESTSGEDVLATVAKVAPAVGRVVEAVVAGERSS